MGFPFRGPAPTADDQTGILGKLVDWAARLNAGLTAPSQAGLATNAQVGVTQLATLAEVVAGTLDTKAITPLGLAGWSSQHRATSLADLNTKAQSLPSGSLISLNDVTLPSGAIISTSVWWTGQGNAYPLSAIYASGTVSLRSDLSATFTGTTYSHVRDASRITTVFDIDGHRYSYTGASTWTRTDPGTLVGTFAAGVAAWDSTFTNEVRLLEGGREVEVSIGVRYNPNSGNWTAGPTTILTLPPGFFPARNYTRVVSSYGSGGWGQGAVPVSVNADGTVQLVSVTANTQGLFGSFSYSLI